MVSERGRNAGEKERYVAGEGGERSENIMKNVLSHRAKNAIYIFIECLPKSLLLSGEKVLGRFNYLSKRGKSFLITWDRLAFFIVEQTTIMIIISSLTGWTLGSPYDDSLMFFSLFFCIYNSTQVHCPWEKKKRKKNVWVMEASMEYMQKKWWKISLSFFSSLLFFKRLNVRENGCLVIYGPFSLFGRLEIISRNYGYFH